MYKEASWNVYKLGLHALFIENLPCSLVGTIFWYGKLEFNYTWSGCKSNVLVLASYFGLLGGYNDFNILDHSLVFVNLL